MKHTIQIIISKLQYQLGAFLFFSGVARVHYRVHEFAMRTLQRAADSDHTAAQLLIGKLLKYRGATVYNKISGVNYLRQSANKGSPEAQFMLAEALVDQTLVKNGSQYKGIDVGISTSIENQKDSTIQENPADLYLLAAGAGHAIAALRLSKIYKEGTLGLERDLTQSEYWFAEFMKHGKQD